MNLLSNNRIVYTSDHCMMLLIWPQREPALHWIQQSVEITDDHRSFSFTTLHVLTSSFTI